MSRNFAGAVLVALFLGGAAMLIVRGNPGATGSAPDGTSLPVDVAALTTSQSCEQCHPEVYQEWLDSQHAIAFVNPLVRREDMADGFRKKDCIPCHAPRPVFEHGLGKSARVLARDIDRASGIDCLSCHKLDGGVASTRSGLRAACNPIARPELATTNLCAPCHNQHFTVDEWENSPPDLRGRSCNHCHMPPVERPARDGLPVRTGRSHRMLGGNDLKLLKSAASVTWSSHGAELVLSVTNSGCAHNLPTDARHRALDLVVTLLDDQGRPVGPMVNLGAGENGGTARLRFRNPYRDESGKVDTQIPAGESRELRVAIDQPGASTADIRLLYKRTPFIDDEEAVLVFQTSVSL